VCVEGKGLECCVVWALCVERLPTKLRVVGESEAGEVELSERLVKWMVPVERSVTTRSVATERNEWSGCGVRWAWLCLIRPKGFKGNSPQFPLTVEGGCVRVGAGER